MSKLGTLEVEEGNGRTKGGPRTLIVVYHIAQMISPAVVCFANAHRVVREVDIAVIACELISRSSLRRIPGSLRAGIQKTVS